MPNHSTTPRIYLDPVSSPPKIAMRSGRTCCENIQFLEMLEVALSKTRPKKTSTERKGKSKLWSKTLGQQPAHTDYKPKQLKAAKLIDHAATYNITQVVKKKAQSEIKDQRKKPLLYINTLQYLHISVILVYLLSCIFGTFSGAISQN